MKTATKVFLILGMIGTIIGDVYLIVSGFMLVSTSSIYSLYIIFGLIGLAISIIVGSYTLKSVSDNDKKIGWGIASIFFVGIIGGILYLCWDPYEVTSVRTSNSSSSNSNYWNHKSEVNKTTTIQKTGNDRIDQLNNMKAQGMISEEAYSKEIEKENNKLAQSDDNKINNIKKKLEELKKMKDEGLISQEVYDQKSKELIDKM